MRIRVIQWLKWIFIDLFRFWRFVFLCALIPISIWIFWDGAKLAAWAVALQLYGVALVIEDVTGSMSPKNEIIAYFQEVWSRRPGAVHVLTGKPATTTAVVHRPTVTVGLAIDPEAPVDKRIEVLEKIVKDLNRRNSEREAEIYSYIEKASENLKIEISSIVREFDSYKGAQEVQKTAELSMSWHGALYVSVGMLWSIAEMLWFG